MKKGFSDRRVVAVLILLLCLEMALLLRHFGFLTSGNRVESGGILAGHGESSQNDLLSVSLRDSVSRETSHVESTAFEIQDKSR